LTQPKAPAPAALTAEDKRLLLGLARAALEAFVREAPRPAVAAEALPPALLAPASCFVTLFHKGRLRGCVGGLEAERPLYQEACQRACQAAEADDRFRPVEAAELIDIEVEISVLSALEPLAYAQPADLARLLRPGVDGVILGRGRQRATFLPQVWAHVPDPESFLGRLCEKLGAPRDAWRRTPLEAARYTVEVFCESDFIANFDGGRFTA
jgi:AmmeMemoRadiSam system protein A